MLDIWNSELKIKISDLNWVGKIAHILKLAKTSQFPGISRFQISKFQIPEISRCLQKLPKINIDMLHQSFLQIFSKKPPISGKKLIYLVNPASEKWHFPLFEFFWKKIGFRPYRKVSSFEKLYEWKFCPILDPTHFHPCWWTYAGFTQKAILECFFLFPWVHWFCSRILKPWSDFLAVKILSYFNVQQRGD